MSSERGMVTAEIAIASLAVVALAAGVVGVFGVAVAQVRCIDVAAQVARQAARGDQAAADQVARTAPHATVSTGRTPGGMVEVTCTAPVRPVPGVALTLDVVAKAVAPLEPGLR